MGPQVRGWHRLGRSDLRAETPMQLESYTETVPLIRERHVGEQRHTQMSEDLCSRTC